MTTTLTLKIILIAGGLLAFALGFYVKKVTKTLNARSEFDTLMDKIRHRPDGVTEKSHHN